MQISNEDEVGELLSNNTDIRIQSETDELESPYSKEGDSCYSVT